MAKNQFLEVDSNFQILPLNYLIHPHRAIILGQKLEPHFQFQDCNNLVRLRHQGVERDAHHEITVAQNEEAEDDLRAQIRAVHRAHIRALKARILKLQVRNKELEVQNKELVMILEAQNSALIPNLISFCVGVAISLITGPISKMIFKSIS